MSTRHPALVLAAIALLLAPAPARSEQKPVRFTLSFTTKYGGLRTAAPASGNNPALGLALAGGGARAAASIGVLKVLDREGIPVFAVAGTSMGSIVGGLYAAGYRPDEIEQIFLANDWNDIFKDTPSRAFLTQEQKESGSRHLLEFTFRRGRFIPPSGLSAGQKLSGVLTARTLAASFQAGLDFDKLSIPFRAVATDIETGEAVVLGRGLLHDAMRASSAIPLAFQPVEFQGRLLVDGGLVNNLPVDVARSLGAGVVIAVDASTQLEKKERLLSLFEIMSQSISLQVRREAKRQSGLADLVLTPDTSAYAFTDFDKIKQIIRVGEETAQAALPRIRELMRPKQRPGASAETYRITNLSVRGNENVPEATIRYAMATALPSRDATGDDIRAAMAEVSKLGYFSDLSLELRKEGTGHSAVLLVQENPVVRSIDISGNSLIPPAELMAELDGQLDTVLNVARLIAALDSVIGRYRSRGYLLVHVERAGMKQDGRTLEIALNEGRVDAIRIAGDPDTKLSLIMSQIATKPGVPLNFEAMARDVQRLYGLDYFESLNVDITESARGGVDLSFKIKEKPTTKVRLGLRYDLEDSFTGLTDVVADNLTGRGIKVYLNSRYGNYTDVALGYHSPVFLRTSFLHTLEAFYRRRNYFLWDNQEKTAALDVSRVGVDVSFGYQWFRFGDTFLRYRYTSDKTSAPLGTAVEEGRDHIGSWAFLTTVDTRDSHTFAHSGVRFKGSYETVAPSHGGDVDFRKTALSGQGFIPLGERHTVIFEASAGFGSGTIPYHEKFGIGGADYLISTPLLGYQRREFVGMNEMGISAAYQWKIKDYQLKAVKAVYLTLTGQAANVWDNREAMSFHELRNAAGIGIHADTLVGPFKLDFGAGEDRRYMVYFSAGFDF